MMSGSSHNFHMQQASPYLPLSQEQLFMSCLDVQLPFPPLEASAVGLDTLPKNEGREAAAIDDFLAPFLPYRQQQQQMPSNEFRVQPEQHDTQGGCGAGLMNDSNVASVMDNCMDYSSSLPVSSASPGSSTGTNNSFFSSVYAMPMGQAYPSMPNVAGSASYLPLGAGNMSAVGSMIDLGPQLNNGANNSAGNGFHGYPAYNGYLLPPNAHQQQHQHQQQQSNDMSSAQQEEKHEEQQNASGGFSLLNCITGRQPAAVGFSYPLSLVGNPLLFPQLQKEDFETQSTPNPLTPNNYWSSLFAAASTGSASLLSTTQHHAANQQQSHQDSLTTFANSFPFDLTSSHPLLSKTLKGASQSSTTQQQQPRKPESSSAVDPAPARIRSKFRQSAEKDSEQFSAARLSGHEEIAINRSIEEVLRSTSRTHGTTAALSDKNTKLGRSKKHQVFGNEMLGKPDANIQRINDCARRKQVHMLAAEKLQQEMKFLLSQAVPYSVRDVVRVTRTDELLRRLQHSRNITQQPQASSVENICFTNLPLPGSASQFQSEPEEVLPLNNALTEEIDALGVEGALDFLLEYVDMVKPGVIFDPLLPPTNCDAATQNTNNNSVAVQEIVENVHADAEERKKPTPSFETDEEKEEEKNNLLLDDADASMLINGHIDDDKKLDDSQEDICDHLYDTV